MKTAPPIATPMIALGRWMGDLVTCGTVADGGEFARLVDDAVHPLDPLDELAGDVPSSREPTAMAFVAANRDRSWAALFEDSAAPAAASSTRGSALHGDGVTDGRAVRPNATSGLTPCHGNNDSDAPP